MKSFIDYLKSLGAIQDEKKLKNIKPDKYYSINLEPKEFEVKELKEEEIKF